MSVLYENLINKFEYLVWGYKQNKSISPVSSDHTISDMAGQILSHLSERRLIPAKASPSDSGPKSVSTQQNDPSDSVESDIYQAAPSDSVESEDIYQAAADQFRRNQAESSSRDRTTGTSTTRGYYTIKIKADPEQDGKDRAREGMGHLIDVLGIMLPDASVHPACPSIKLASKLPPITPANSDGQHDHLSYIHVTDGRALRSQQEVQDRDPMGEARDIYGTVIIEHPTVSPANLPQQCISRLASFGLALWTKSVQCLDTVKSRAILVYIMVEKYKTRQSWQLSGLRWIILVMPFSQTIQASTSLARRRSFVLVRLWKIWVQNIKFLLRSIPIFNTLRMRLCWKSTRITTLGSMKFSERCQKEAYFDARLLQLLVLSRSDGLLRQCHRLNIETEAGKSRLLSLTTFNILRPASMVLCIPSPTSLLVITIQTIPKQDQQNLRVRTEGVTDTLR